MNIHEIISKNKSFNQLLRTGKEIVQFINTGVITLNLLHSGKVRGGILKNAISANSSISSAGKSFIGLSILKEAQKMGMECIVIDSEKSFDHKWASSIGVDVSKDKLTVVSTSDIIAIKQLISVLTDEKTRDERHNIFVLLDSWGTLVSPEVVKKSLAGNDAQDMVTPKRKNELANIMKHSDFTYYVINHVIDNTGGFGDPLQIPGGRKLYFNSDSFLLGQSKKKDTEGDDITGTIITAIVHKGRRAVEKTKLQYRIKHDGGLDAWFGLLPDAEEHGCVVRPTNGYFSRPSIKDDKKWRESQIYCSEFWVPIFKNTDFESYLDKKYSFEGRKIDLSGQNFIDMISEGN